MLDWANMDIHVMVVTGQQAYWLIAIKYRGICRVLGYKVDEEDFVISERMLNYINGSQE